MSDEPEATGLIGVVLDSRYRVIEAIAEGAMGVVYRAERVKLGRIVAIKVMHDSLPSELSSRQRFEIEAMAMAKLEHPHCAAVLDVGLHDGKPFVVMDFVSGDNLKDLLEIRAIPIVRVVEIMRQVLSGLAHAHELGIVHRDIKPANIVLSQKAGLGDHVKILDFGLARLNDAKGPSLTVGMVVGTPSYMAPEQCIGNTVDARTDLYACGVMLFELLTGKKPFVSKHDDPVEVVRMHIQQPPPTLAEATGQEFGPELEYIVARALAKKPDDRYASATAFAAELDVIRNRLFSQPVAIPSMQAMLRPDNVATASGWASPQDSLSIPQASAGPSQSMPIAPSTGVPVSPSQFIDPVTGASHVIVDPSTGTPVSPSQFIDPLTGQSQPIDPLSATYMSQGAHAHRANTPGIGVPQTGNTFFGVPVGTATPARGVAIAHSQPPNTPPAGVPVQYPPAQLPTPTPTPSPTDQPIAWIPLDRKQLKIAGGVVGGLVLLIIIGIAASGGKPATKQVAAIDAGVDEIVMDDPPVPAVNPSDPAADLIVRAQKLLKQNNRTAALSLLDKGHDVFPDNAQISYMAGNINFAKLFWTAGIKHYRNAIRLEPAYKSDPELIKTALWGFLVTPSYNSELAAFLRTDIGPAAASFLEETATSHPTKGIRDRAAGELKHYK